MKKAIAATLLSLTPLVWLALTPDAGAQVNAGKTKAQPGPFNMTTTDTFELPWRIAFLPDGRMLVTEKVGPVWLVSAEGKKIAPLSNTPAVFWNGQNGMLGAYVSPNFATDGMVYLTYVEPGDYGGGLALARGKMNLTATGASFGGGRGGGGLQVIWRQMPRGQGGQAGGAVAFSPDGQNLFLTVGDRMRFTPAQDPDQPVGKILRLTLDGKPAPGNPWEGKMGAKTIPLIDPPADSEAAKTAKAVSSYTFPGNNLTPAETWTLGHRTPYGLAFAPDGSLWVAEHAPRSGDELNRVDKGKNYGWPAVAYGPNYSGIAIPHPDTRVDMAPAAIYWDPNVAPGGLMFYTGNAFPQLKGNGILAGLGTRSLNRIILDGKGGATPGERYDMGKRMRDVAQAPDGTLWVIEDANPGALIHLTPKQ